MPKVKIIRGHSLPGTSRATSACRETPLLTLLCPLKIIRLVLRPGTGLCDLILVLIRDVITSTLHKSAHITCELSFGKIEPRICIPLTMLHAQSALCWFVLRPVYCNRRYRSSFLTLCPASQSYATGLKYSRRKHTIYLLVA